MVGALILASTAATREPGHVLPGAGRGLVAALLLLIRRPLPETPTPPLSPAAPDVLAPSPEAAIVVPANAQYVCVSDAGGQRQQTVIEFSPRVASLCRTHPEMGPCQYERNACRRSGGRVYAAGGKEITMATEAEYDKKVLRIRLKSN